MDGAGGDQEVVVLAGRPHIHILFGGERAAARLCGAKIGSHSLRIDALAQSKVDGCIGSRIEHVVAFVLRVGQAELLADIAGEGMDLEGEVAAFHGIEKIEADGEFGAEVAHDVRAEKCLGIFVNQGQGRQFKDACAEAEREAVLFRNAVEAPGVIGRAVGQIKVLAHPLTAPGAGIEEGHQAERALRDRGESRAERVSAQHRGGVGTIAVDPKVYVLVEFVPLVIGCSPVEKEGALVQLTGRCGGVGEAQAGSLFAPLPLLNLPAGHIDIDEQIVVRQDQCGAGADGDDPASCVFSEAPRARDLFRIEERVQFNLSQAAKDGVVPQHVCELVFNLRGRKQGLGAFQNQLGGELGDDMTPQRFQQDTGIALDGDAAGMAMCTEAFEYLAPADGAFRLARRYLNGGVLVEIGSMRQSLYSMSGIAPRTAASDPSVAARSGMWRPKVQACAFT